MRTNQEIVDRVKHIQEKDFFGFSIVDVVCFLSFDLAKPFLNPDVTAETWKPAVLTDELVIKQMKDYMPFAIGKATDHRGLSAERSINHFQAWLWLLGDEETLAFAEDDANYPAYGAPILKRICDTYKFECSETKDEDFIKMATMRGCSSFCENCHG